MKAHTPGSAEKCWIFFDFFEVFHRKPFLYSELQWRDKLIESDWEKIVLYRKLSENGILGGLKLRRLTPNQTNLD